MLRAAGRLLLTMIVVWPGVLVSPVAARANGGIGGVTCATRDPRPGCDVNAGVAGHDRSSAKSGGAATGGDGTCRNPSGTRIPCERDGLWAGADGCYYVPTVPWPSIIEALGGQPAGDGGWYMRICYSDPGGLGGVVWVAGAPPAVSAAVLARQARARLTLPSVVIRTNPSGDQLVNLPVWLALDPASWTPQSATAAAGAVSVTATARPVTASWAMGDGTTVTCTGPGTAWTPGIDPRAASPDCGHVYRRSSATTAGGAYPVTVTVTWAVAWAGAGQSGTVPGLTTTGQRQLRVQESQAVISH